MSHPLLRKPLSGRDDRLESCGSSHYSPVSISSPGPTAHTLLSRGAIGRRDAHAQSDSLGLVVPHLSSAPACASRARREGFAVEAQGPAPFPLSQTCS